MTMVMTKTLLTAKTALFIRHCRNWNNYLPWIHTKAKNSIITCLIKSTYWTAIQSFNLKGNSSDGTKGSETIENVQIIPFSGFLLFCQYLFQILYSPSFTRKMSWHVNINKATTQSLELCEKRGECPGLPIPKSPHGLCRCKATTLTCRAQDLFVKDSLFTKFHKENALTCGKHVNIKKATTQSSELFERRGGHSGLPIPKRL